jgi:hypothetical protein
MNGWKYEWIRDLPQDVYEVLIQMIADETQARDQG